MKAEFGNQDQINLIQLEEQYKNCKPTVWARFTKLWGVVELSKNHSGSDIDELKLFPIKHMYESKEALIQSL